MHHRTPSWRGTAMCAAGMLAASLCALAAVGAASATSASAPSAPSKKSKSTVLYVGTFRRIATPPSVTFSTIQAAVDAAKKGDWILVAPGDYHESDDAGLTSSNSWVRDGDYGGVVISTPDLHLRGMDRNTVIVDGTSPTSSTPCSAAPGDQSTLNGLGRNGIVVWKADGVSIDNLTVCNFLAGSGDAGNEIWWNGGDGSGRVGLHRYSGTYLTATSTYFDGSDADNPSVCATCALYGVFSSNSSGGSWDDLYANNFSDSGMYVGACHRICDVTVDHAWMENNALGYSGTNSGGGVVIEHSTFDDNKEGLDTNTALTGDPPPPQDGECRANKATSTSMLIPGTHVNSCWVFMHNLVEDNNNPDVPVEGTAGLGPTGTGMTLSGGRNDTVVDNEFLDDGAWGILFVPYPDPNTRSDGRTCAGAGGIDVASYGVAGVKCVFDPEGDFLSDNKFSGDGSFANPGNADYGNLLAGGNEPDNCFAGNTEWDATFTSKTGPATDADAEDGYPQLTPGTCGAKTAKSTPPLLGPDTDQTLLTQAECDSGVLSGSTCTSTHYPQPTSVVMQPLPKLPTMPNPCDGVPANLWCPGGVPATRGT